MIRKVLENVWCSFLWALLILWVISHIFFASAETMFITVGTDDWLNGRSKPSKHASVECRFYHGDEVNVLEMADGWAKLDYGGDAEFSYVSWDYLSGNEDGSACQMVVSCNGPLRVRNNPAGKKVVGKLKNGDVVNVAFFFDGWAKVDKGWVDAAYLMAPEEVTP